MIHKSYTLTEEQQKKVDKIVADAQKEFAENYPALVDLYWVDNEVYYLKDGKKIPVTSEDTEKISKDFEKVASKQLKPGPIHFMDTNESIYLTKEDKVNLITNKMKEDFNGPKEKA